MCKVPLGRRPIGKAKRQDLQLSSGDNGGETTRSDELNLNMMC